MSSSYQFDWVTDNAQLADQLGACAQQDQDYVCIDTEFIRRATYWPRAALIQLHTPVRTLLIDPILIDDWSPLARLLADSAITKVLHAAGEDLQVLYRLTGHMVRNLFDTQVAYALLSDNGSVGYSTLVSSLLHVTLEGQEQQRSDWLRRPLTEDQCRYALSDAIHLDSIYHKLKASLARFPQRVDWLGQLCQKLLDQTADYINTDGSLAYTRIKGVNGVRSTTILKRLRSLASWREQEARRRDLVRNHLIRDEVLMELAKKPPTSRDQWQQLSVGRKFKRSQGIKALQECIIQASQMDDNTITLPALFPKSLSFVYKALLGEKKRVAAQLGISHQLLGSNKEMQAFILTQGQYSFTDWRDEVLLGPLQKAYNLYKE